MRVRIFLSTIKVRNMLSSSLGMLGGYFLECEEWVSVRGESRLGNVSDKRCSTNRVTMREDGGVRADNFTTLVGLLRNPFT